MIVTAKSSFLKPQIFASIPNLIAAESTRHGGVSQGAYASLNVGISTEDDPAAVEENRRIFFNSLGLESKQIASAYQVHGAEILKVETPGRAEGYDALISNVPHVFLTVTIADCTPILIADPHTRAVAAIHAGWRGTVAEIVRKTMLRLQEEYRVQPENCVAYIGTCIDECSFEVNADVADHFGGAYKRWDEALQKYFVDLKAANRAQLLQTGIPAAQIEVSPYSTVLHNADFFSYRQEKGITGRMLNLIGFAK
ncbi:MAG TPA: peptidoglycan editing factor PgeF [Haliscomenobacter sp.]|uniref:peptidoglycan editing factor PgeF n=1 Tax=Haliscomenobacter sp. TaxID=2717303 RepID=UPI002BED963C|nr:peptidoglycan editing factor PgeF [Haliscomenobacter sp.]HOY16553.1 peptidoglycan editing factor PgeF [Haliscomenobacter sp.]